MSKDMINLFVSHYHTDCKKIQDLVDLLDKNGVDVRDSSIYEDKAKNDAHNEEYIKSLIRPQIEWAGKIVVLVGPHTSESDWVNWEIQYAAEHGKRIVGIFIDDATDVDLPSELLNYGDALVTWDSDLICRALDGEDIWLDPQGEKRETPVIITRGTCR